MTGRRPAEGPPSDEDFGRSHVPNGHQASIQKPLGPICWRESEPVIDGVSHALVARCLPRRENRPREIETQRRGDLVGRGISPPYQGGRSR